MNILVLLPVNDRHRAILESSAPGEDFIYTSSDAITREQVANADVILGNIDPDMLTACEHLQLLQLQTAGYDDYLAAGTVPADAKLSCSVGAYGQAVSEHMFAMVLSMMKRLPGYHDLQREHRWEDLGPVTSLKNANVLVLGAGDIGGHFATLCRNMGAHVRGIKRHPLVYPIVFEDMDSMDALPERLAEADIVASFMPSTPETRGLANAEFFAAMKPGAFFANGGRGGGGGGRPAGGGPGAGGEDPAPRRRPPAPGPGRPRCGAGLPPRARVGPGGAGARGGPPTTWLPPWSRVISPAPRSTSPTPSRCLRQAHCGMRLTCSLRRISRAGSIWPPRSTMWSTLPQRICVTCKPARPCVAGLSIRLFRRFTKRRNPSTLRARQSGNLPFNRRA